MKNEKLFMILAYPIIIFVSLVAIIFIATPLFLYAFPQMYRLVIGSSFVIASDGLTHAHKIPNAYPFYISAGSSTVYVLHILPEAVPDGQTHLDILKGTKYKTIMYFHKLPRDMTKFASFCNALLRLRTDVQIVSFDYKGIGDAAGETTKSGAIEDARTVFNYLRRHSPMSEIHFWGHALGAGIAAAAMDEIMDGERDVVRSIVLEAPFFDTFTQLKRFFAVELYSHILPRSFFTNSLNAIDLNFNTTRSVARVDVPALILNGEHDQIAGPDQVRKLVADVRRHRDFVFHVEWRCKSVQHHPGHETKGEELAEIIERFHHAVDIFWEKPVPAPQA